MELEIIRLVLRYTHFVSWAALIGGTLVQIAMVARPASPTMRNGARLAFLTGMILVAVKVRIAANTGGDVNDLKFAIKAMLTIPALLIIEISGRRDLPRNAAWGVLSASVLAMAVAVFWT